MERDHGRKATDLNAAGHAPSIRQRFVIRQTRGRLVLQKWPKKRGPNQTPAARYWVYWLAECMRLWNYGPAAMKHWYQDGTRGIPAKAPDIYLQMQRGKWGFFTKYDGTWYPPKAALDYMSYSLDLITNKIGGLLVRGTDDWEGIEPGAAGQILTAQGPSTPPIWSTPSPTQFPFTVPTLSDFTVVNQTVETIGDTPQGIQVSAHASAGGDSLCCLLEPMDHTDDTITLAMTAYLSANSQQSTAGIVLYNTLTGKAQTWALANGGPHSTPNYSLEWQRINWSDLNTASAIASNHHYAPIGGPIWFRMEHNSLYRTLYLSLNGTDFEPVQSVANTDYLTPNRIGFFLDQNSNTTPNVLMIQSWAH